MLSGKQVTAFSYNNVKQVLWKNVTFSDIKRNWYRLLYWLYMKKATFEGMWVVSEIPLEFFHLSRMVDVIIIQFSPNKSLSIPQEISVCLPPCFISEHLRKVKGNFNWMGQLINKEYNFLIIAPITVFQSTYFP